jgi:hypothetical protein
VDLAKAAVRLASVAGPAKQLNIRSIAAAPAGKRDDVIVFQIQGAAATPTLSAIPGINDFLGGRRYIPALRKTAETE